VDSGVDITNVRKRLFKEKAGEFVKLLAEPDASDQARKLAGKFDKLCTQVETGAVDGAYFVEQLTLNVRALQSEKERNAVEKTLDWVASQNMSDVAGKLLTELRISLATISK